MHDRVTLNPQSIKRLLAEVKASGIRRDVPDPEEAGLTLRITPTGASWNVRYRPKGTTQQRRYWLGTLDELTVAKAHKKAREIKTQADHGADPAHEQRVEVAAAAAEAASDERTVAALAKLYIEKYAKKNKRTWADDERYLDVEVLPKWKHRRVADLKRADVRALLEAVADRGSPYSANRLLAVVRKMLNFAIKQDWIESNPATLIDKPGVETSRDRVLNDDEIRLVWKLFETERPQMCALQRLRLITAQRGGELAKMRWDAIERKPDGTLWFTIPASVAKNKREHHVPLTPLAIKVIQAIPRDSDTFVFPGRFPEQPMSDQKKAGQRLAKLALAELQKTNPDLTRFDFRGHDLRRTAATRMGAAGISRVDIARVLNHVDGGPRATAIYDRYEGDAEKLAALRTWDASLTRVLAKKKSSTAQPVAPSTRGAGVIPFKRLAS